MIEHRKKELSSGQMITRARKALETMTILENAKIMLNAGLLTREQYDEAEKKFGDVEKGVPTP